MEQFTEGDYDYFESVHIPFFWPGTLVLPNRDGAEK